MNIARIDNSGMWIDLCVACEYMTEILEDGEASDVILVMNSCQVANDAIFKMVENANE